MRMKVFQIKLNNEVYSYKTDGRYKFMIMYNRKDIVFTAYIRLQGDLYFNISPAKCSEKNIRRISSEDIPKYKPFIRELCIALKSENRLVTKS